MLIQLRVRSLAARCWAYLRTHPRRVVLLTLILPATGVFGGIAVLGALMSAVILGAMGLAVVRGPVPSDAGLILLLALWGPAGIAGLLALWSWALSPPPATRLQLGLTVAGIATGIAALAPWMVLLFSPYAQSFGLLGWFALLLLAVAAAALLDLLVRLSQPRNRGAAARDVTIVLYDGACPLCRTEMLRLKRRDPGNRLRLVNIAASDFNAPAWGFSQAALGMALHVRSPEGRWLIGMAAIRHVYARVGLGWLLAPTGWRPLRRVFDAMYAWVARHRLPVSSRLLALGYGRCDERCSLAPQSK
jgi:predicted DCC family thiol-disulfide oxidoreductase YuxK